MNQFLKNHQLNKAEIGVTDESILDWISGSQDTFSSKKKRLTIPRRGLKSNFLDNLGVDDLCNNKTKKLS